MIVITGNGKGKTTSALGMALRAAGYKMRVCVTCFIKGDLYSGEFDGIKRLSPEIEIHVTGRGFVNIGSSPYSFEEHRTSAQNGLILAMGKMASGTIDILILDEIHNAIDLGLVDLSQILDLIDTKPEFMHLILTGRGAHQEVIEKAHTVTEMKEIKHSFSLGIEPQKGIDY
ncbi:MAG: cob(I)yrinic acid a,c-diamide adenosyltransferase [Nitrospirae bacterium]|nr:cob(I)yrinic acid a,c-diamide adenosyltransferase [Nitrospirota bacterium]